MGNSFPDPLLGPIEIPPWLTTINDEPAIKRMMRIKQLGLKEFINFPSANHTRYMHSLGTMFLAGKLTDLLVKKEENSEKGKRTRLADNLKNNKNVLMAAGFFHDIGHGPFSHVLDFVIEKEFRRSHEEIATEIVKHFAKELEGDSIPVGVVNNIIAKVNEPYPHLLGIINGPLDVDKVDYLLRDSFNVGLKYSFDSSQFLDQIAVLGDGDDLEKCQLGLEKTPQAVVCTELFLLMWKSMYTLVYLIQKSRIAEKMLEKAILFAIDNGNGIKDDIENIDRYMELDEAKLLNRIRESDGFPKEIYTNIFETSKLYVPVLEEDLNSFKLEQKFLKDLLKSQDSVSEKITQELSKLESGRPYSIICDIVSSKNPKEIYVDEKDENGEPIEIKDKSYVIKALTQPQVHVNIYLHPKVAKIEKYTKERGKGIRTEIQRVIDGW
jgi:HD superfamily phosphohydrolase